MHSGVIMLVALQRSVARLIFDSDTPYHSKGHMNKNYQTKNVNCDLENRSLPRRVNRSRRLLDSCALIMAKRYFRR